MGGGSGKSTLINVMSSSAKTEGMTAGARIGMATANNTIAECDSNDTGSVYHLRLPIETDGRVTSPNKSRGMAVSLCLFA
jgi:hypothetical protein